MKQLLILSGKGGTGKTTTSASFIAFSDANTFADCDVDAPNLHLVTNADGKEKASPFIGSDKAYINKEDCIGCNACLNSCRFNAIIPHDGYCEVNALTCEGCGVCQAICPAEAVSMQEDIAGDLMLYKGNKTFSTAKLKMGRGTSGKLVAEVKNSMKNNSDAGDNDIAIIDGSPGIGCPVIASISGVDMVLIVAEPSFSGISDMKRILETCKVFQTKTAVCVNKYDTSVSNTEDIEKYCNENGVPFIGKIPYDPSVPEAVNMGKSIAETECPAQAALKEVYKEVIKLLK